MFYSFRNSLSDITLRMPQIIIPQPGCPGDNIFLVTLHIVNNYINMAGVFR